MLAFTERTWFREIYEFTECLVSLPTVSPDITGENTCAQTITDLLCRDTTLTPELWPTGDGRYNVACLLRGEHPANHGKTLILMGHYDTVDVTEFAGLAAAEGAQIAFQSRQLRDAFVRVLAENRTAQEQAVWNDLNESWTETEPAWMFGRGCLDMKSGVAIAVCLMRRLWCERESLAGNVLFLACPDEENESTGIRSALKPLLALRQRKSLHYLGIINTDYVAPRTDQDEQRYVYAGTVGKLLPSFYILGVPTHVGEPFRGIDADQIAAELVQRINLNPALCDRGKGQAGDEITLPPITLRMRDLKSAYSAQTVAEALVCVNWLTYTQSPHDVLHMLVAEARDALLAVFDRRDQRYDAYPGSAPQPPVYEPAVLTFHELCQRVCAVKGWNETALNPLMDEIAAETAEFVPDDQMIAYQLGYKADLPERSRLIAARLAREANLRGPAVIVFFAPPYYPHVQPHDGALMEAVKRRIALHDDTIRLRHFYPYISDLSFVGVDAEVEAGLPALRDNMPLFGRGYTLDFEAMWALNCPVVNIGPWGKDAHGLYERVYMPYSFEVVPQLIYEVVKELV